LAHSRDEEIAAIACFDIGEFVRHYPNGKHIARRLGARDVVMGLIEHEDTKVQRQALLCISKMLVQNWQVSSPEWCTSIFLRTLLNLDVSLSTGNRLNLWKQRNIFVVKPKVGFDRVSGYIRALCSCSPVHIARVVL
jgi:hypothetical protein